MVADEGHKGSSKITGISIMNILGWTSDLFPRSASIGYDALPSLHAGVSLLEVHCVGGT